MVVLLQEVPVVVLLQEVLVEVEEQLPEVLEMEVVLLLVVVVAEVVQ